MNGAEVSSLGHPEDVATTVGSGVLPRTELDQGLKGSVVYVHEATEVNPARDCANLLIESPNAMIHPEELWSADKTLAVNRQARRLDQGQEYQEAYLFWRSMSFRSRK